MVLWEGGGQIQTFWAYYKPLKTLRDSTRIGFNRLEKIIILYVCTVVVISVLLIHIPIASRIFRFVNFLLCMQRYDLPIL